MLCVIMAKLAVACLLRVALAVNWQSINYYAGKDEGWANQWRDFEEIKGQIQSDFDIIKGLGAKSFRTFIQYDLFGSDCNTTYLDRLDSMLGFAKDRGLRMILGLDGMPDNTTLVEQFVACIGSRFGQDERIWMFDFINEPDGRVGWTTADGHFTETAVIWLKSAFNALVRHTTQPITAGCVLGWDYLQQLCRLFGPSTRYIPQMHVYPGFDPTDTSSYANNIIQGTLETYKVCAQRRIFLGEWGRPGHDSTETTACLGAASKPCNEANQELLYSAFAKTVNQLLVNGQVLAVSPWTLNEFTQHGSDAAAEREAYFGIARSNGNATLKPAAVALREWYSADPRSGTAFV
eukprot:TRINITY_DN29334_c0_g1_i1.p1 TRINITY_DN29334_c0_g1~~TRINITY_DN29334_c0_g1_i1.p1  ORF type:complete len:349 (+),score=28.34 TRINITY_DN29334_c0_g1_i1:32-1078(+)